MHDNDKDFEELVEVLEIMPHNKMNPKAIRFIEKRFEQYSYLMSIVEQKKAEHYNGLD